MNCSLHNVDRTTHLRILLVAIIAAVLVIVVGKSAQIDHARGPLGTNGRIYTAPRAVPTEEQRKPFMPTPVAVPRAIV